MPPSEIGRVTFMQTVRWPGRGVIESATEDMWGEVILGESNVLFKVPIANDKESGFILIVPYSNVRWIAGSYDDQPNPYTASTPKPSPTRVVHYPESDTYARRKPESVRPRPKK